MVTKYCNKGSHHLSPFCHDCLPWISDICHQVLDLYSAQQQAQKQEGREVSPPMATGPRGPRPSGPRDTPPPPPRDPPPPPKRTRMVSRGSWES